MTLHAKTLRYVHQGSHPDGESIVHVTIRGTDWCVTGSWKARLLDECAPNWFSLENDARGQSVKSGHGRTIWRVQFGEYAVYAKVRENVGAVDRIKRRLLGTAAEREWRASREAMLRGIPVVEPLGVGVRNSDRRRIRAVVLTKAWEESNPLSKAWCRLTSLKQPPVARDENTKDLLTPSPTRRAAANALIRKTAELFAVAHDRGFVHRDAHPGNVLVRIMEPSKCEAAFVDVLGARFMRRAVPMSRAVASITQLHHYFRHVTTRTDRLRFLRGYLSQRVSLPPGLEGRSRERAWMAALSRRGAVHGALLAKRRDRRLRRNGKYFSTITLDRGWSATVTLTLERRHRFGEPNIEDRCESDWRSLLQPLLMTLNGREASSSKTSRAGISMEYNRSVSLAERIRLTFGASPHRRAFEECHRRRHRDDPADLILGYAEHRTAGLVDATVLIRPSRLQSD